MKVMQLLPELNSGGVERGTLEIARALVKEGISPWWSLMVDGWWHSLKLKAQRILPCLFIKIIV